MRLRQSAKAKLKIVAILLVVAGAIFGLRSFLSKNGTLDKVAQTGSTETKGAFAFDGDVASKPLDRPLVISVNTWGGFAAGQLFNEGFTASEQSRFFKDYGLKVEFKLIDDFNTSREAFKAGKVDLLWATIDSFPTEIEGLAQYKPKVFFQADWSQGGDAIVVRRGINSVQDLKGKKIAVAFGTPSHTFLLWMLKAGDLKQSDVTVVQTATGIDSAAYFKAGKVDAAVVWSPDDLDCVAAVSGSKVLTSTKQASNLIADVFYVKDEFLKAHPRELAALVEGWMKGAAEINGSDAAKRKASKILAKGLNVSEEFAYNAINNTRISTYGDNVEFFKITSTTKARTGEEIYAAMAQEYHAINFAPETVPSWREISDTSILRAINTLTGPEHAATGAVKFEKPTVEAVTAPAISTKRVTVTFGSGSALLTDDAKYTIQTSIGDLAKSLANARIRVEGNTDSTGPDYTNRALSKRRAEAIVAFLVEEYGFDINRFVVVGNGPDKPVGDNATEEGRALNRRTDFEFIN